MKYSAVKFIILCLFSTAFASPSQAQEMHHIVSLQLPKIHPLKQKNTPVLQTEKAGAELLATPLYMLNAISEIGYGGLAASTGVGTVPGAILAGKGVLDLIVCVNNISRVARGLPVASHTNMAVSKAGEWLMRKKYIPGNANTRRLIEAIDLGLSTMTMTMIANRAPLPATFRLPRPYKYYFSNDFVRVELPAINGYFAGSVGISALGHIATSRKPVAEALDIDRYAWASTKIGKAFGVDRDLGLAAGSLASGSAK